MAGLGEFTRFPFKRISIFMSTAECSGEESKENIRGERRTGVKNENRNAFMKVATIRHRVDTYVLVYQ